MIGGDSMGPDLQRVGARFSNFLLGKLSRQFKVPQCRYFTKFKWPHFRTAWCYSHMVGLAIVIHVLCMSMWPWPDPRSRSRSRSIWTFDRQPLAGFLVEFPSRKAITTVQTSPNVDISRNSTGHISVVRDKTDTWLDTMVVLYERKALRSTQLPCCCTICLEQSTATPPKRWY